MPGRLILCATPIGNLEDMSYRAVRTLQEADLIAAEDTRNSIKLLNHFDIHTPMISYHEYNKVTRGRELVERMLGGENVALITDAGTPGISDPGEDLAAACIEAGIPVSVVPGPAACISALIMSGLPTRRFAFEAFLPADKKERQTVLEEMKTETRTIVLYEAPHRLVKTLQELAGLLGGERRITVCRELTKKHESALRTTLENACAHYEQEPPKGECVLVIAGRDRSEMMLEDQLQWQSISIEDHVRMYEERGYSNKEALKLAAKDRGCSKRELYQYMVQKKDIEKEK